MENYTAKQVREMFDDAESQPYVQYQRLKKLSSEVVAHSTQSGCDWQRTREIFLYELITDLLHHSDLNDNDIRETVEDAIEDVKAYNKMVTESDRI
jgi:hypothetical protein